MLFVITILWQNMPVAAWAAADSDQTPTSQQTNEDDWNEALEQFNRIQSKEEPNWQEFEQQQETPATILSRQTFLPILMNSNPSVSSAATSATYQVTKVTDSDDGSCNSDCSLREAANAAAATGTLDTILVPSGIYSLTLGSITLRDHLQGAGARNSIIDGNNNTPSVINIIHDNTTLTIGDITIRNGRSMGIQIGDPSQQLNVNVTLSATILMNNGRYGNDSYGAIRYRGTGLTIRNSVIRKNRGWYAGGLYAEDGAVNIFSSLFYSNTTSPHKPLDAIYLYGGGGMEARNLTLNLSRVIFDSNASLTIASLVIGSGVNRSLGGGLVGRNSQITIKRSLFVGNRAETGGGLGFFDCNVSVENSTISGNIGERSAGGIYFANTVDNGKRLLLNYTSVVNNSNLALYEPFELAAGILGHTFQASDILIQNSIIALNHHATIPTLNDYSLHGRIQQLASGGYNLFGTLGYPMLVGATQFDQIGGDLKLGALAVNGDSMLSHLPLAGSPSINAANPTKCPSSDQRRIARPQGNRCDIGAIEVQNP